MAERAQRREAEIADWPAVLARHQRLLAEWTTELAHHRELIRRPANVVRWWWVVAWRIGCAAFVVAASFAVAIPVLGFVGGILDAFAGLSWS